MDIPTSLTPQTEKVMHQTRRTRIKGLDKLRGFAIVCMLFLHGFQFFEGDLNAIAAEAASNPFASIIKFMGRWAGIFVIISGFVNGSSIIRGIREGRKTPRTIWKELGVIGIWFVAIEHLIFTLFVRTSRGGGIYGLDEGPHHYSFFTGWLETGVMQSPSPYLLLVVMGAISGLGYSLIILGIFFSFILKDNGIENIKRVILTLSIGGTFFVALSPLALLWLRPMWIIALENNSIFKTLLLGLLIADTHPLFPLLGYMFYGAALGVCFAAKISRVKVIRIGGIVASGYTFMGALLYAILGDPPVSQILQTTPIQVTYLQSGLMLWLLLGIYWFTGRQTPSSTTKKTPSADSFLERFGKTSLTIYLIEGFIGSVIKVLILDPIFPGWALYFPFIIIYNLTLICLWSLLLVYWQKSSYKYSLEWITVVFIKPIAQKSRK